MQVVAHLDPQLVAVRHDVAPRQAVRPRQAVALDLVAPGERVGARGEAGRVQAERGEAVLPAWFNLGFEQL